MTIDVPGEFIGRVQAIAGERSARRRATACCLARARWCCSIVWSRYVKRVPAYIVALFAGTAAAMAFGLDVATIGSRFGGIPSGLPHFQVPAFRPQLILTLLSPAFTVAMLGAIESLLSAVVADRMGGDRHNPNTELFAQGVANIVSPLFGGLPATGALARTATNIRSGARSPVVGHDPRADAARRAACSARASPPSCRCRCWPRSCSSSPGTWASGGRSREIWKQTYADVLVWLATFLLTVLADLTVAVEVGMVMAALLFIRRVSRTTTVSRVTPEYIEAGRPHILQDKIDSGLRRDLPHPRSVPVWIDRQAARHRTRRRSHCRRS